jgi:hypothetical protein
LSSIPEIKVIAQYGVTIRPGLRVENSIDIGRMYQEMMMMEEHVCQSGDSLRFLECLVASNGKFGLCLGFSEINLPPLHGIDAPQSLILVLSAFSAVSSFRT